MATLEDLVNQYATELPDYLRKPRGKVELADVLPAAAPAPSPVRSPVVPAPAPSPAAMPTPAVTAAPLEESIRTIYEKETPSVAEAVKRLREEQERLKAETPALEKAMKQAYELRRRGIESDGSGRAAPPVDFSPAVKEAIAQEEKKILEKIGSYKEPKSDSDVLSQALLAFVPAIVGAGIGAVSRLPGGAWAGLGAGGQAGAKTLEAQQERQREKAKLEQERYLKDLNASVEVFKERIKTLKEPELINMRSLLNFSLAASEEKAKQAIQKGLALNLGKVELDNLPEVQSYNANLKAIEDVQKKINEALGEVPKAKFQKIKETKPAKEGKEGKEGKPKEMTPAQQAQFAAFNSAEQQLLQVIKKIEQNKNIMGPIMGRLGGANPYAVQAQKLNTELGILTSAIARSAEGARMSDQDIKRFTQQAPQISNDPEVALEKAKSFLEKTRRDRDAWIQASKGAGVNVPKAPQPVTQGIMTPEQRKRLEELKAKFRK